MTAGSFGDASDSLSSSVSTFYILFDNRLSWPNQDNWLCRQSTEAGVTDNTPDQC